MHDFYFTSILTFLPPLSRLHSTWVPVQICSIRSYGVGAGRRFYGATWMHRFPVVPGCEVDVMLVAASELRLKYDIPTIDSIIAATGIVNNVKHILTDYDHFKPLKNMIKPIDLKNALKLALK